MSPRWILTALFITLLQAAFAAETPPPVKIVFVCEHGSAKSVIAAKHLERLAHEKGLQIQAISRGTIPDAEIPAAVRKGLSDDGIDVGSMKPAMVRPEDLRDATRVISFGPDVAAVNERKIVVEDWSTTPAVSEDYVAARSYIVKRLQALLEQLSKSRH